MRFDATIAESDGVTVKERLEADDEQALHDMLGREGRMLVRAKALDAATNDISVRRTKMSQRRLLLLTQALHEALDAGVPLLGTFQAISEQEADPNIALMLEDLGDRVAAGQPLSDAIAECPRAFPPLYVALVRAGEQSGSLPDVLNSISTFLEWRIEIGGTVKQAMIYPAVVATAGYAMILFLLSFVIPRLSAVIEKIGTDLPPASRMLVDSSAMVADNIGLIVLGSIAAVFAFFMFLRNPGARAVMMKGLSVVPVVSQVVKTLAVAQFARTFSVLLNAGLTMTGALELSGAAVSLPSVRERLEMTRERILGGARLAEALEEAEVLPPVALSMVQVGEEAGRLPRTFDRLSKLYDREVKAAVKRALGMLEPLVTVFLGLVVGGVAVLVVLTIYSAMRGIGK